ncbi:unnamed protein product [Adineta steineri]|uniref:Uncharacterized protein n=1 Tax=Adineta steineri TaxID=433720 RepID=A0A815F0W8_9BILA|nr:unnamed protein product [Adineta steineri]CAF1319287.1 unnamed protein product [Adineta steineri]
MYYLEQGELHISDQQTALKDRYNDNNQNFQEEFPIDAPELNNAATKIQAQFRGHKTRRNLEKKKHEKDETIDSDPQKADYANKQSKTFNDEYQESSLSTGANSQQQNNQASEDFNDDLTEEEKQQQERAATSIQAQFRGFKTRQNLQKTKQEKDGIIDSNQQNLDYANEQSKTYHDEDQELSLSTDTHAQQENDADEEFNEELTEEERQEQERAAIAIQAQFRGFKTRQNFQKMKHEKDGIFDSDQQNADYANEQSSLSADAYAEQQERDSADEDNYDDLTEEEKQQQERAAVSIQAQFRGFKTRQNLQKEKHEKDEVNYSDQQKPDSANEHEKSSLSTDAHAQQQERDNANEDNYDDLTEEEKQQQERAATSIQAQFRGFKTRQNFQKMKQEKDGTIDSDQQNLDYANEQSKTYHDEDQKSSLSTDAHAQQQENKADEDNYDELTEEEKQQQERAAVSIQAQFRGFKTRQNFQKMKQEKDGIVDSDQQNQDYANQQSKTHHDEDQQSSLPTGADTEQQENKADEDNFDNLTEEEKQQQERAATSIQAQFRGFKTRQNFQKMKQEKDEVIHSDQQKVDYANEQSKTDNDEDQKPSSTAGAHSQQQENKATEDFTDKLTDEEKQEQERAARSIQKFDNNYDRTATDVSGRHNLDEKLITPEKKNDDRDRLHSELEEETQFSKDFAKHTQLSFDSNYFQEQQNEFYNNDQDDMSDPNLDKAATRIQASYRGYKTRKELGTPGGNSITGQDQIHPSSNSPKIHDEYGNTRNKNILSPSAEGNKVLVGEDDDSAAAAVKIQAAYRGYRVRKDLEK